MPVVPDARGARRAAAAVGVEKLETGRDKKKSQRECKFKEPCQNAVPLLHTHFV